MTAAVSETIVREVIKALGASNALDLVLRIDWGTETVRLEDLEYALTAPDEELVSAVTAAVNAY